MNEFDKLKNLLEGSRILRIEAPNAPEAICKFVLTDNSAFRLHATDLGFWVEETAVGDYPSLDVLVKDVSHHMFYDLGFDSELSIVKVDNKFLFVSKDKDFVIVESNLSEVEKRILNSDFGIKMLIEAVPTGDFWKMNFSAKNEDCPTEFYLQ